MASIKAIIIKRVQTTTRVPTTTKSTNKGRLSESVKGVSVESMSNSLV